jgi:hypothetical protein
LSDSIQKKPHAHTTKTYSKLVFDAHTTALNDRIGAAAAARRQNCGAGAQRFRLGLRRHPSAATASARVRSYNADLFRLESTFFFDSFDCLPSVAPALYDKQMFFFKKKI